MKKALILIPLLLANTAILAQTKPSAVNSQNCSQLIDSTDAFILVLKKGENVPNSILKCVSDAKLNGVSFTGLGAFENTTLSYFDHEKKTYDTKTYPEFLELISLTGNVSFVDGKPTLHAHIALSDDQFHMIGGHLADADIGATGEITIIPMSEKLVKSFDEETGLDLIVTQ